MDPQLKLAAAAPPTVVHSDAPIDEDDSEKGQETSASSDIVQSGGQPHESAGRQPVELKTQKTSVSTQQLLQRCPTLASVMWQGTEDNKPCVP